MMYCHRSLNRPDLPRLCLKEHCSMWNESEEECLEVFILHDKARKIWREEQ